MQLNRTERLRNAWTITDTGHYEDAMHWRHRWQALRDQHGQEITPPPAEPEETPRRKEALPMCRQHRACHDVLAQNPVGLSREELRENRIDLFREVVKCRECQQAG